MKEADLKLAVTDYLQYAQNQGKLVYLRLNAGDFIEVRGDTRRRVKGCPKGTADLMVIKRGYYECVTILRAIFLELKSAKGKQTKEQAEFQQMIEEQGAEYYIIRSIERLQEVLNV